MPLNMTGSCLFASAPGLLVKRTTFFWGVSEMDLTLLGKRLIYIIRGSPFVRMNLVSISEYVFKANLVAQRFRYRAKLNRDHWIKIVTQNCVNAWRSVQDSLMVQNCPNFGYESCRKEVP